MTAFLIAMGVAVVAVGVGAVIAWRNRKAPGILKTADGIELFAPKEHLPFLVLVDPALGKTWLTTFEEACTWWNVALGFDAFAFGGVTYEGAKSGAGIIVAAPSSEKFESRFHSKLMVRLDGAIIAGPVYVNPDWSYALPHIAAHELGHAGFGLARRRPRIVGHVPSNACRRSRDTRCNYPCETSSTLRR